MAKNYNPWRHEFDLVMYLTLRNFECQSSDAEEASKTSATAGGLAVFQFGTMTREVRQ